MFERLSSGVEAALLLLRGSRTLTDQNMQEGLATVRQALLDADVNYDVAHRFAQGVAEQARGQAVLKSVRPYEQFIKIVHEELTALMGPVNHEFRLREDEVTVLMVCGLQGSGKTTTCGKLARFLKEQGAHPLLVPADLQRPAAVEQLRQIGAQLGVPVFPASAANPVDVCTEALAAARRANAARESQPEASVNVLIVDTAGRLHVDEALMEELQAIDQCLKSDRILFVCDAMTGQDAATSARAFNEALELDSVILTKLDGDARGGAALSIKGVTGVGIQFIGVGEQLDRLELFHPERMASRILGMGDVVTLVEKAQQQIDEEEALRQQAKMAQGRFTLVDFQRQMAQVRKLGPMRDIMKMIPGMGKLVDMLGQSGIDPENDLDQIDAIINAMTPTEREAPEIVNASRRERIARGTGVEEASVSKLLRDFNNMAQMMKQLAGMGVAERLNVMKQIARGDMFNSEHGNPGRDLPWEQ